MCSFYRRNLILTQYANIVVLKITMQALGFYIKNVGSYLEGRVEINIQVIHNFIVKK